MIVYEVMMTYLVLFNITIKFCNCWYVAIQNFINQLRKIISTTGICLKFNNCSLAWIISILLLVISSSLLPRNLFNMHWQFRQTIYISIFCSCATIFCKGEFWPTSFSIYILFPWNKKRRHKWWDQFIENVSLSQHILHYSTWAAIYMHFPFVHGFCWIYNPIFYIWQN